MDDKQKQENIRAKLESEEVLYNAAKELIEYMNDELQESLAVKLENMPLISKYTVVSALADTETQINNYRLLETIGLFIASTDKILAQASAICLLTCAGIAGKEVLQNRLQSDNIPHLQLIRGIIKLTEDELQTKTIPANSG